MATQYLGPGSASQQTASGITSTVQLPGPIANGSLVLVAASWSYNFRAGGFNPDGSDPFLTITDDTPAGANNWTANLRQDFDPNLLTSNGANNYGLNTCITFITAQNLVAGGGNKITLTFGADMHCNVQVFWFNYGDFVLDKIAVYHGIAANGNAASPIVTTTYDGALVIGYLAAHSNGRDVPVNGISYATGYTGVLGGVSSNSTAAVEYQCQPTAGVVAASFTTDYNAEYTSWIIAFRPYGWVQSGNWPSGANTVASNAQAMTLPLQGGPVCTGHTVVIMFGWTGGADDTVAITDNASGFTNNYAVRPRLLDSGHGWGVAYCTRVQGHPTTFTVTTGTSHATLTGCAYEFGGYWSFNSANQSQVVNTAGTFAVGSVTPIRGGTMFVSPLVNEGNGGGTPTVLFQRSFDNLLPISAAIELTMAPFTPQWTWYNTGSTVDMWVLSFTQVIAWQASANLVGSSNVGAIPQLQAIASAAMVGTGAVSTFLNAQFLLGAAFTGGAGWSAYAGGHAIDSGQFNFAGAGNLFAWADWMGNDPLNPGIDEIAGEELLYRNATGLEKAMADVDAYRLTVTYAELVRDQWDPYAISSRNLGYLAWAMGVNLWEDDWSDAFKRWWVANQWTFKYYRGSDLGLKMAVEAVGCSIVRLTRPPAQFFPGPQLTPAQRAEYVSRFPQLRLYPYAPRPQLPWLNYLGGVTYKYTVPQYVNNGRFLGPLRKFYPTNYNAGGLYLRSCTIYDPATGVETPITVRTIVGIPAGYSTPITYDQISLPSSSDNHFYPGVGNRYYFFKSNVPIPTTRRHSIVLGMIDSTASRIINVPRDGSLAVTQYQGVYQTIAPSLQPLNVNPQMVSTPHPIRKTEFYCGQPLVGKFLPKSNAWQYLYEMWYLFDPTRQPTFAAGNTFMGRSRFGIRKYSAEAKIAAYWNWPKRYTYYGNYIGPGFFFAPQNTDMIDKVRRAVTASMAARDTVAINTRVKRIIQLRDVTKLDGTFKVGQWITDSS